MHSPTPGQSILHNLYNCVLDQHPIFTFFSYHTLQPRGKSLEITSSKGEKFGSPKSLPISYEEIKKESL